ncbi:signal peptidase I [Granulosicoccus antarcticus]|uniref:Signal peptidase I n=1 Tax=Granulosicoccus antarcticus IMCC3135 TaxID=1192854 RepID=A0A2Z2NSD1_9GAMM|nr:signal peptidase I [Granulosicoccus antarcticus]ASJ74456.1 Signal peptidase I [Granulosicoccus antarcticus IMCC3135]
MPSSWADKLNFPLLLVVATAVTGLIWLVDALFFAPKRKAAMRDQNGELPILVEYVQSFFPVLLVVLVLRSFLFEPFRIPSGSMIPTLLIGDFILVNKFSYGVRLPVLNTKILDTGSPERGDVAVFRYPQDPSLDYIKRVVGLPGDSVVYENRQFIVNGEAMPVGAGEPYVSPVDEQLVLGATTHAEKLGEVDHQILQFTEEFPKRSGTFTVPEGHYFMVGDNRDRSNDSRFWGFVPEENLVGQAKYIWMHWNEGVIWSRLFSSIK